MVFRRAAATLAGIALLAGALVRPTSALAAPVLPAGFHASIYAQGLSEPTAMAFGPDGRLYVTQATGSVAAIGKSGIQVIATVPGTPLGLAWHAGKLYVSFTGEVETLSPSRGYRTFAPHVIISGLPTGRRGRSARLIIRTPTRIS